MGSGLPARFLARSELGAVLGVATRLSASADTLTPAKHPKLVGLRSLEPDAAQPACGRR